MYGKEYCSLHANPLAWSLGQVKLDSDKWKLWKNLLEWIDFFSKFGFRESTWKNIKPNLRQRLNYWNTDVFSLLDILAFNNWWRWKQQVSSGFCLYCNGKCEVSFDKINVSYMYIIWRKTKWRFGFNLVSTRTRSEFNYKMYYFKWPFLIAPLVFSYIYLLTAVDDII